jgi:hypothetical protein
MPCELAVPSILCEGFAAARGEQSLPRQDRRIRFPNFDLRSVRAGESAGTCAAHRFSVALLVDVDSFEYYEKIQIKLR